MRRWAGPAAAVVVAVFAVLGVWSAVTAPETSSLTQQTRQVAQTLRCPTCAGEDVADSAAPLAEAMRLVVAEQLAEGRSPEQIRAWFAERYGDEVLLDPPRRGAGWLLWAAPILLVGLAAAVLARRWLPGRRLVGVAAAAVIVALGAIVWSVPRGQAPAGAGDAVAAPGTGSPVQAVPVLRAAVAHAPGDAELRLALARHLEEAGRAAEAVEHYAAAARLRPLDADLRYRHAFALVRSGADEQAREVLTEAVRAEPEHAPSLLLLGTLHHREGRESGAELLRRFLDAAPEHPAAAEVRQWLAGTGTPDPSGAGPGGAG